MKKNIILALVISALLFTSGCNRTLADLTYKFDRAIVSLPNGDVVEGAVDSWADYEDSDQIQVTIDGTTYLVHSENVVLIND